MASSGDSLTGRKKSLAFSGSLSRDGIVHWLEKTIKHSLKYSEISNQGNENNGFNGTGTTSGEGVAPNMQGIPDLASAGRHQETDRQNRKSNKKKQLTRL